MADRNTTQKDPQTRDIVEKGQPRCKKCFSRLTVVERDGVQSLWCFNCQAPFLGGLK